MDKAKNNDQGYYEYFREDLLAFVPVGRRNRMLEIGAGGGNTLLKAKELGLAGEVVGIEPVPLPGSNQNHRDIDRFIIGDVEDERVVLEKDHFDVILCGDVLEHLVDPWRCLSKLRASLRQGGIIIASIPNVRYWRVSTGLLFRAKWAYCDSGVLDRTHLRFFVKEGMVRMFQGADLIVRTAEQLGPQRKWGLSAWLLNKLTFGVFSDLLTVQYIIVASRP